MMHNGLKVFMKSHLIFYSACNMYLNFKSAFIFSEQFLVIQLLTFSWIHIVTKCESKNNWSQLQKRFEPIVWYLYSISYTIRRQAWLTFTKYVIQETSIISRKSQVINFQLNVMYGYHGNTLQRTVYQKYLPFRGVDSCLNLRGPGSSVRGKICPPWFE